MGIDALRDALIDLEDAERFTSWPLMTSCVGCSSVPAGPGALDAEQVVVAGSQQALAPAGFVDGLGDRDGRRYAVLALGGHGAARDLLDEGLLGGRAGQRRVTGRHVMPVVRRQRAAFARVVPVRPFEQPRDRCFAGPGVVGLARRSPVAGTSAVMAPCGRPAARCWSACARWSPCAHPWPECCEALALALPGRCARAPALPRRALLFAQAFASPARFAAPRSVPGASWPAAAGRAPVASARDSRAYGERARWAAPGWPGRIARAAGPVASAVVTGPADGAAPIGADRRDATAEPRRDGRRPRRTDRRARGLRTPWSRRPGSLAPDRAAVPGVAACLRVGCPPGAFDMPTPLSTKPATPWLQRIAYSCALTAGWAASRRRSCAAPRRGIW